MAALAIVSWVVNVLLTTTSMVVNGFRAGKGGLGMSPVHIADEVTSRPFA